MHDLLTLTQPPHALEGAWRGSGRLPWHLELLDETGSTNRVAAERGAQGKPEGWLVVADRQTAGRGRLARTWFSPAGLNLYLSILLRPSLSPSELPWLSFLAALAVRETAERLGVPAGVKWPNDVLSPDHRKLSGVLSEARFDGPRVEQVVVGIGINVNARFEDAPPEVAQRATSLSLLRGQPCSRSEVLLLLLEGFERRYSTLQRRGSAELLVELQQHCLTLGQPVTYESPAGVQRGKALRIDDEGALWIQPPVGAPTRVTAGDVQLVEAVVGTETPVTAFIPPHPVQAQ